LIAFIVVAAMLVLAATASAGSNGWNITLLEAQPVSIGQELYAAVEVHRGTQIEVEIVCGGVVEDDPYFRPTGAGIYDYWIGTVTTPGTCSLELWTAKAGTAGVTLGTLEASSQFTVAG
jgi:hypothetical protein